MKTTEWHATVQFRWHVNNKIPSDTTSVLQQEWANNNGETRWIEVPVVFSNPIPLRDTKS